MDEINYPNNQINIVAKIAYLIGVRRSYLEIYTNIEPNIIDELDKYPPARIVRSLCQLRCRLMINFLKTENAIKYDLKNLDTIGDIYQSDIKILKEYGVSILKANYRVNGYIVDINELIRQYINKCKELFPEWLEWKYIRNIFLMPNGNKEEAIKNENAKYKASKMQYPYSLYINWRPGEYGNILISDKKFLSVIYTQNGDIFDDRGKVTDASDNVKSGIYDFIDNNSSTVIVVDCENVDPYKLYSVLKGLNQDELSKVKSIMLYDDIHTSCAWRLMEKYIKIDIGIDIPFEYNLVERIKSDKSLVDLKMTAGISAYFYRDNIKSFILCSSDSDYWGVISSIPDANFLVMIEYGKSGPDIKNALESRNIFYCYMDDFCTGNINQFKTAVLNYELHKHIDNLFELNANMLVDEVFTQCRLEASEAERNNFYDKFIKTLKLKIDSNGRMYIDTI